jgi:hypothetical protein
VAWVNQDHPALLRINPSLVNATMRQPVRGWATLELRRGSDFSILLATDLERLARGAP